MRPLRLQVQLQTVLVDIEKQGDDAAREYNREILSELAEEIRHKDIIVQTPAELLGVFKCKEYSNTAYYAGPFTLGPNMNIRVKVCPSLRPSRHQASAANFRCHTRISAVGKQFPDDTITTSRSGEC